MTRMSNLEARVARPDVRGRERCVRVRGGDDVPAGTAAAQVIERGEPARDVIGRVERGRAGSDEADMVGHLRERREQRKRLERCYRVAALERIEGHVEHGHVVGHEEGIEFGPLQRLDAALHMRKVEIHVRPRARIAPGTGVDARRPHECTKVQLTCRAHVSSLKFRVRRVFQMRWAVEVSPRQRSWSRVVTFVKATG